LPCPGIPLERRIGELGFTNTDIEPGGVEEAFVYMQLFFDRCVPLCLSVEEYGPELSGGIFRAKGGAEERVPDPKRERAPGVVGSLEETFIVPRCWPRYLARLTSPYTT